MSDDRDNSAAWAEIEAHLRAPHTDAPKKPSTLELIDQASLLVQSAIVAGAEIPIEAMATWEGQVEDKLTALFYVHQRLGGEVALLAAEADRITDRMAKVAADQARVKGLAADLMVEFTKVTERKKCKTPTLTFSVQETKVVCIYDEDALDPQLWVTPEPRVDKAGIKALLLGGQTVPGAELGINHHMKWK